VTVTENKARFLILTKAAKYNSVESMAGSDVVRTEDTFSSLYAATVKCHTSKSNLWVHL